MVTGTVTAGFRDKLKRMSPGRRPHFESLEKRRLLAVDLLGLDLVDSTNSERPPAEFREEAEEVVTVDGLRLVGRNGWGLIRASNTEPALILRFEAASPEKMQRLRTFFEGQLATVQRDLGTTS